MESTFSAARVFTLSKTVTSTCSPLASPLHGLLFTARPSRAVWRSLDQSFWGSRRPCGLVTVRSLWAVRPIVWPRLECVSRYYASFASGGGGGAAGRGGSSGDGGGGGEGGLESGDGKSKPGVGVAEEGSSLSPPDVIILDVGGMTCGGCAASVKRILESQPQVSSASVNLTTETAIVWPVSEAKVVPNWNKQLGEALAKHLTICGFKSNLRGLEAIEEDIPS